MSNVGLGEKDLLVARETGGGLLANARPAGAVVPEREASWLPPVADGPGAAQSGGVEGGRPVSPVSVLMATYARETAESLDAALSSVFAQTVRPLEIVIVLDGPIGDEQEAVLQWYAARAKHIPLVCVRLKANGGLAAALNAGLEQCRGQFVLRMDSDDVCMPNRLERQWQLAQRHPEIDCIGGWHLEFEQRIEDCDRMKTMPERHEDLVRALKWRNVFSHPTMFIKTDVLRRLGGYREIKLLEDYDCLIRLINSGYRLHALQEPVLYYRRTPAQMQRRGGWSYFRRDLAFRFRHAGSGFFSPVHVVSYIPIAVFWRLAPSPIRTRLYRLVRRQASAVS